MNTTALLQLMEAPELIGESETRQLETLSERFPYCQAIQMLYTKGLHNQKSIDYLDRLKLTAALTTDRQVLYRFIMQEALLQKIAEVVEEAEKEATHDTQAEVTSVVRLPETTTEAKEPEPALTAQENAQTESLHQTETVATPDPEALGELLSQKLEATLEKLVKTLSEKDKETSAAAVEITAETEPNHEQKKTEDSAPLPEAVPSIAEPEKKESTSKPISEFEKQILWEAVNASIHVDVIKELEERPTHESAHKEPEPAPKSDAQKSFLHWLKPLQAEKDETAGIETAQPDSTAGKKQAHKPEDLTELVERFIRSEPKITPQKAEFYSPGNMAKLSITDNEEFVSETLASIYEKQGYLQKAIRVYEKLSLKFPEKSAYFASRIKNLETIQKNAKNKS